MWSHDQLVSMVILLYIVQVCGIAVMVVTGSWHGKHPSNIIVSPPSPLYVYLSLSSLF